MSFTRRDRADPAAEAADIDRGALISGAAVTELPIEVGPPALDPATGGEGAGVSVTRGDDANPAAEAADINGGEAIRKAAVSELPGMISTPALDPVTLGDDA